MSFVDTHVHLHFPDFQSDFDGVIKRAREAGVRFFINVGTDLKSSEQAIALAERFEFVYATVGIHPHDVKDATPEAMRQLAVLAKHPKVVAIGEVGLDFYSPQSVGGIRPTTLWDESRRVVWRRTRMSVSSLDFESSASTLKLH